jgi:hypothetical protein
LIGEEPFGDPFSWNRWGIEMERDSESGRGKEDLGSDPISKHPK